MVHANNDEMLTVSDWKAWVEAHLRPVVDGLRGQRVYKEIFLAVGNESLAPWHVEKFGGRLVPCMKEVSGLHRTTTDCGSHVCGKQVHRDGGYLPPAETTALCISRPTYMSSRISIQYFALFLLTVREFHRKRRVGSCRATGGLPFLPCDLGEAACRTSAVDSEVPYRLFFFACLRADVFCM